MTAHAIRVSSFEGGGGQDFFWKGLGGGGEDAASLERRMTARSTQRVKSILKNSGANQGYFILQRKH